MSKKFWDFHRMTVNKQDFDSYYVEELMKKSIICKKKNRNKFYQFNKGKNKLNKEV